MTRFLELLISVALVVALFVVIGLFLPDHGHVERKVELGNPMAQVYDTLNGFKRYNSWQPWLQLDPRAKYEVAADPEFGVGAKISWESFLNKQVGKGTLEITESDPEGLIKMSMINDWKGTNKVATYTLEQSAQTNAITVTWAIDVDYGMNLIGRYAGLYLNGGVGELMNDGLGRLSNMMAGIPNVDYSQVEVTVVDVPAAQLVFVGQGVPAAPRQWDEADTKMTKAWEEVDAFIAKNKLHATGPHRRVINVLGEEDNDFNLATPVAPNTAVVTGHVLMLEAPAGRAITMQYRGHRVGLQKARDMLKAYALTHGYDFDRDLTGLWEEWLPDDPEGGETLTNVFLPIR
jgi:Polyketide cyclase / dehydrase and lipid transport